MSLGISAGGAPIDVDLDRLIGSHALAIANSGGGKSGLVRRLLETTHGRVPHIVLDPEDELYTLRERYSYVIAGGDGADAPATIAGAADLAQLALRHRFSLIVQMNDLGADAPEFVARFLEGLLAAPRELWGPVLVAIDELQRFAPSGGGIASSEAVKDLVFRGRKRGFTLIGASLRITEIDAGVRGMVNNWMLGRVGQTLDRNTMADQLGFSQKEGREKLRGIEERHFWGFGPAIAGEPVLFRVSDVETTPVRPGQAKVATPPPPDALREILQGLADTTKPDGQKSGKPGASDKAEVIGGYQRILDGAHRRIAELEAENAALHHDRETLDYVARRALEIGSRINQDVSALLDLFDDERAAEANLHRGDAKPNSAAARVPADDEAAPADNPVMPLPRPEKATGAASDPSHMPPRRIKIVDALSWLETFLKRKDAPRALVAWLADTTPSSSTFEKDLGAMRTAHIVDYPSPGTVSLTGMGRTWARKWESPGSRASLLAAIAAKLPPRRVTILRALWDELDARPRSWLAAKAGVSVTSSTFEKDLGAMRTLGLIDYPAMGWVVLGEDYR